MTATDTSISTETLDLREVDPDELVPNPLNPRRVVLPDDDKSRDFVASIKASGVLEPALAFERARADGQLGTELVLLAGHRRREGALKAGRPVPVWVRPEPPESEQLLMMLVENGQRNDLAPLEEARAYATLIEQGVQQKDIADRCGRSEGHVSKRLAIVQKLPESVIARFDADDLSIEAAYALSRIADDEGLVKKLGTSGGIVNERYVINEVKVELERRATVKKVAKAKADLEKAGVDVVDAAQVGNGTVVVLVGNPHSEWDTGAYQGCRATWIAITIADHESEACHCAAVNANGDVIYVCAAPDSHEAATIRLDVYDDDDDDDPAPTVESINEIDARNRAAEEDDAADSSSGHVTARRLVDPAAQARFENARDRTIERRSFLVALIEDIVNDLPVEAWPVHAALAYPAFIEECEIYPNWNRALELAGIALDAGAEVAWIALFETHPAAAGFASALSALEGTLWHNAVPEPDEIPYWVDNDVFGDHSWIPTSLVAGYLEWLGRVGFDCGDVEAAELADVRERNSDDDAPDAPDESDAVEESEAE